MILFATDLDQTLIFGDAARLGPMPHLVEEKDGAPISYMSAYTALALQALARRAMIVPVTTRSVEQYRRIRFPGGLPDYALAANGAVLLEGGRPDADWWRESRLLIEPAEAALIEALALLKHDPHLSIPPRRVDGAFCFCKSQRPEETIERLSSALDPHSVTILRHGGKVYVLPRLLHKGQALRRLRKRLPARRVYCAGDSAFDLSLLEEGDLSFAPRALAEQNGLLSPKVIALSGERPFSDLLFEELHKLLDEI